MCSSLCLLQQGTWQYKSGGTDVTVGGGGTVDNRSHSLLQLLHGYAECSSCNQCRCQQVAVIQQGVYLLSGCCRVLCL